MTRGTTALLNVPANFSSYALSRRAYKANALIEVGPIQPLQESALTAYFTTTFSQVWYSIPASATLSGDPFNNLTSSQAVHPCFASIVHSQGGILQSALNTLALTSSHPSGSMLRTSLVGVVGLAWVCSQAGAAPLTPRQGAMTSKFTVTVS